MRPMKSSPEHFRVPADGNVTLKEWPTSVKPIYRSKEHYQKLLSEHVDQLSKLQRLLGSQT